MVFPPCPRLDVLKSRLWAEISVQKSLMECGSGGGGGAVVRLTEWGAELQCNSNTLAYVVAF